jgi:integration host factor subunit beta
MATITKKDLIDRIARDTGLKRVTVKKTIQQFLDEVVAELEQGNRLEFRDFGVFEVRDRAARRAQNPKTLERLYVPPKRTVRFKAGRLMREAVETPQARATHVEVKAPAHLNGHIAGAANR